MPRIIAALFLLPPLMGVVGGAMAEPTPSRQAELLYMLKHDCGSCHGMTLKGGLGVPLLPQHLAARDAADLAMVILDGIPDTPMPPWRALLTPDEAGWLAIAMKQGRALP